MGIKIDVHNEILKKAKIKKDGCYRHKGIAYRVLNSHVTHFGSFGEIYECFGSFTVLVGKYEYSINSDEIAQKILKKI